MKLKSHRVSSVAEWWACF